MQVSLFQQTLFKLKMADLQHINCLFTDLHIAHQGQKKKYLHIIHTEAYEHQGDHGELRCASLGSFCAISKC